MAQAPNRNRRWVFTGIASVLLFLAMVGRFWHPVYGFTAFFQLDASNDHLKLPAFRALPVYVYRDTGGYDGLYYAQIALDPSLRDSALPRAMDNFSYRARRILPSAVAYFLGFGRAAYVISAYALVNVTAWLALAIILWRVLDVRDCRSWLAWADVLFSAGTLASVRLALTDLPAATLLAAAIGAAERERKRTALACVALGTLARETSFLGIAGLIKPPWFSVKNLIRVVLAGLPLVIWLAYVRHRVGPADPGWGNLTWPVSGFLEKWWATLTALVRTDDPWLAWTTLLSLVGLTAQMMFIITRPEPTNRWWRVGAGFVVLLAFLGTAVWEGFPGAATRVLLPLTLAFNVLGRRSQRSIAWLIAGNLTIFSGLLAFRDVPSDPTEIGAARRGEVACIAHTGTGWYDREQTSHHRWWWARQAGTIRLETWPKTMATIQVGFGLRSLTPETVILRENGREVWHGESATRLTRYEVEVNVPNGGAELEFLTTSPPVREGTMSNARALGFALYDLRVGVPEQ